MLQVLEPESVPVPNPLKLFPDDGPEERARPGGRFQHPADVEVDVPETVGAVQLVQRVEEVGVLGVQPRVDVAPVRDLGQVETLADLQKKSSK